MSTYISMDQPPSNPPTVLLPLIYDIGSQTTQLADRRDLNTPPIIIQAANMQLRKFMESRGVSNEPSSLYAAIHDLLTNLQLPMPPNYSVMSGQGPNHPMQMQHMNNL